MKASKDFINHHKKLGGRTQNIGNDGEGLLTKHDGRSASANADCIRDSFRLRLNLISFFHHPLTRLSRRRSSYPFYTTFAHTFDTFKVTMSTSAQDTTSFLKARADFHHRLVMLWLDEDCGLEMNWDDLFQCLGTVSSSVSSRWRPPYSQSPILISCEKKRE